MNHAAKKGFTIIELVLAMSFVSVLLIAIALTVIQIAGIYNRGITIKDVNQAGRDISSELQRSVASSLVFDTSLGGGQLIDSDWGGRLCMGKYSYIWNYGKDIANDSTSLNRYVGSNEVIRFVKVSDSNSRYCTDPTSEIIFDGSVELLSSGEHNLAMHNFDISTVSAANDSKTEQRLYSINFVIGTNNQEALSGEGEDVRCKAPGEAGSDPSYCSITSFSIVARAGNAVQ